MSNFIEQYQIRKDLCKTIIDYFEQSPDKRPGTSGGKQRDEIKKSTEVGLQGVLADVYVNELFKCIEEYTKKYEFCYAGHSPWSVHPCINIQKYLPDEGYFKLHFERDTGDGPKSRRHLVFMTYLNDVTDDGETLFYYQNLKVKPKTGLTLIWPADWTHTHCGITSHSQTKYIVTGWISYV